MMRSQRWLVLLWLVLPLTFLAALIVTGPAQADIAPPDPPYGSNPEPGGVTQVRMISETVVLAVNADSPTDDGHAAVTATFQMRNLSDTEERLAVRFPLDLALSWGNICDRPMLDFPPISDLTAFVNGRQVATENLYETTEVMTGPDTYTTVTRPCWAVFDVVFPPHEDVIVRVNYTMLPYATGSSYQYSYILWTGSGWAGTIGQADIIWRLPYLLAEFNFRGCGLAQCQVAGNEVRWHDVDFEPGSSGGETAVSASFLPPPLWQRILVERGNLARNENDGEAWGRLAKAYKDSIRERRGWYWDEEEGMELYRLSDEAYQRALLLLPQDADWHYGYADLLCWNAEWNQFFTTELEGWQACVTQIRLALEINPQHEAASALLERLAGFELIDLVSLENGEVVYVILTAQPTATGTESPTVSATLPASTATVQPVSSPVPTQRTLVPQSTITPAPSESPTPPRPTITSTPISDTNTGGKETLLLGLFGAAVVVGIMVLMAVRSRK